MRALKPAFSFLFYIIFFYILLYRWFEKMLEDFIKSNELNAKILPIPVKAPTIKCQLFRFDDANVLVIHFASKELDLKKLAKAVGAKKAKPIALEEAEDITGYDFEFIPPVSIYGVKVVVDSKLFVAEKVKCPISAEQVLEITPKEIVESNDEAIETDITQ